MDVNGPGLLTDHHVLFQSGMLTFQITSPSIQWAPRRRTRTLTIDQRVRRDFQNFKKSRGRRGRRLEELLLNSERFLL